MTERDRMRHYWTDTVWATIDAAVARVTSGRPTVLVVIGDPGLGKSSLIEDLVTRAADFTVFPAEGVAGHNTPYGVLDQWGVHVPRTAHDGQIQPFVAAQLLRQLTDAAAEITPNTMLLIDDAQWADVESMEALTWLMRRAAGDRLLVVITSRPVPERRRESWRRWLDTSDAALQITLGGLSYDNARALIAEYNTEHDTDIADPVAERLWLHTLGNPLYLTNLLTEHSTAELSTAHDLPAPTQYATHVTSLLLSQPEGAQRLADALAVLGPNRVSVRDAAAVADQPVAEAADAAQHLATAGLVTVEETDGTGGPGGTDGVRWVHALAARAVYQELDLADRRRLHRHAAQTLQTASVVFEHRVAAADGNERDNGGGEGDDPQLISDLIDAAQRLYDQHSYRTAAHYLRSAARLSTDPHRHRQLRLDAAFTALLMHSGEDPQDELKETGAGTDPIRSALVEGTWHCFAGRYRQGAAAFADAAAGPLDLSDPVPRYRLEVLLVWVRTLLGHDIDLIAAGLQRGLSLQTTDSAMIGYRLLAEACVAGRTGHWGTFTAVLGRLPQTPSATPAEMSGLLVWRAGVEMGRGRMGAAIADLRELQQRRHDGVVDVLSNTYDAQLGVSYWAAGRFDLATVTFRAARDVAAEHIGLTTHAISSLPWSVGGDFAEADRQLEQGSEAIQERPWQEAVEYLLVGQVVRRHAGGSAAAQATLLAETRQRWPRTPIGGSFLDGFWAAHFALAHVWAGEFDLAEHQLTRVAPPEVRTGSARLIAEWVTGLLEERHGRPEAALDRFRTAIAVTDAETPLYRAHALADHARLARAVGAHTEATTSHQQAQNIYQQLQATPYLARLAATTPTAPVAAADTYVLPLTDREYDVLTLVVEGYSYAQISRELFLSQSTVSFHLGNIYPKAGVRSRHELTRWVRQHPGSIKTPSGSGHL